MAWQVFLYALLTDLATGLGAVPFAFVRKFSRFWLGIFHAVAAGLMLAASFTLVHEELPQAPLDVLVGVLLGLVFIVWAHRLIEAKGGLEWGQMTAVDAKKVFMIVLVMTAHSFAEGVGLGVAFGKGEGLGVFISLAIAAHNVPEGLAIALVLVARGVSWKSAALWGIFSSLPQPLMAVPAFLLVQSFAPFLPLGFGFAAGAMLWLVFSEILADALEGLSGQTMATAVVLAVVAMLAFQALIAPAS